MRCPVDSGRINELWLNGYMESSRSEAGTDVPPFFPFRPSSLSAALGPHSSGSAEGSVGSISFSRSPSVLPNSFFRKSPLLSCWFPAQRWKDCPLPVEYLSELLSVACGTDESLFLTFL